MLTPEAAEHAELRVRVQSFEDAVKRLSEAVTVARPNREASVVVVRYEASDTQLVHQVANALALMFITQRRDIQKTGARSTVRFFGNRSTRSEASSPVPRTIYKRSARESRS